MNTEGTKTTQWEANTVRNTRRLAAWTFAWMATLAIASFGPKLVWNFDMAFSAIAVLLNVVVGFGMIVANKNHLRGLDELQQRVQLEAMGLSLGVVLVIGLAYSALDVANVIAFDAEISHLVILMGLTYGIATFLGMRKYS